MTTDSVAIGTGINRISGPEATIVPNPWSGFQPGARSGGRPAPAMNEAEHTRQVAVGLRGVTKRFDEVTAVADLDLDISDGEFFSLLGPSGCGKTTTLRMIAGLDYPSAGSITIFGEEMGLEAPNKRPVNTVFQSYALFPHMSVARNIAFGLEMRKVPRAERQEAVRWAIDLVRLGGMEERRPQQLSGGQQQRVALARALVNRPKVLLLDEPLGALDLKLRQEMQGELKGLQRDVGITFVYVTHDQEEALTMSDRIAVMHEGRLLQVGSPEEIYEHPTTRFVADFIGRTNFLDGTLASADTLVLANGTKVRVDTHLPAGTPVALTVRPEKFTLLARDGDGTDAGTEDPPVETAQMVPGVVRRATYLGNAMVYEVEIDWMSVEVRTPAGPSVARYEPGTQVWASYDPADASVVENR